MSRLSFAFIGLTALIGAEALAAETLNGKYVNTAFVNGKYVNGKYVNGKYVNSAVLNGVGTLGGMMTRSGEPIQNVTLVGTEISGQVEHSLGCQLFKGCTSYFEEVAGQQLAGARMTGTLEGGDPISLRIRKVDPPQGDITVYHVDAELEQEVTIGRFGVSLIKRWVPLCGASGAIPLQGQWDYSWGTATGGDKITNDPNVITWACVEGGALGKCAATLGYKPWVSEWVWNGTEWYWRDGAKLHQACLRMVRADYCGDGTSHTVDGTAIRVADSVGMNTDTTTESGWSPEAKWSSSGAVEVVKNRFEGAVDYWCPVASTDPTQPVLRHLVGTFTVWPTTLGDNSGRLQLMNLSQRNYQLYPRLQSTVVVLPEFPPGI